MRKPLTWMIVAEVCVVGALAGVTWHIVAGARSDSGAPLILPESAPAQDSAPAPDVSPDVLTPPEPAGVPLLPGLNVDPAFWRDRLTGLNQAEAQVEDIEWRIVRSALDTVQRYVNTVVVPSVEHAEGSRT